MPNAIISNPTFFDTRQKELPIPGGEQHFIDLVQHSNIAFTLLPYINQLEEPVKLSITDREITIITSRDKTRLSVDLSPDYADISSKILRLANSLFTQPTPPAATPLSSRNVRKLSPSEAKEQIKGLKAKNHELKALLQQKDQEIDRLQHAQSPTEDHRVPVEEFEQVRTDHEHTLQELRDARQELETTRESLRQQYDSFSRTLQAKETSLKESQTALDALKGHLSKLQTTLSGYEEQLRSRQGSLESLSQEKSILENRARNAEEQIAHFQDCAEFANQKALRVEKDLVAIQEELNNIKSIYQQREREFSTQIDGINQEKLRVERLLRDKVADLEGSSSRSAQTIGRKKGRIAELKMQITTLTEQLDGAEKRLDKIHQEQQAEIETLTQQQVDSEEEHEQVQKEIQQYQNKLKQTEETQHHLQTALAQIEVSQREHETEKQSLTATINILNHAKTQAEHLSAEKEAELERAQAELAQVNEQYQARLEANRKNIDSLTAQISGLGTQASATQSLVEEQRAQIQTLEAHLGSVQGTLSQAQESFDQEHQDLIAQIEKLTEAKQAAEAKLSEKETEITSLSQEKDVIQIDAASQYALVTQLEKELAEAKKLLAQNLEQHQVEIDTLNREKGTLSDQLSGVRSQLDESQLAAQQNAEERKIDLEERLAYEKQATESSKQSYDTLNETSKRDWLFFETEKQALRQEIESERAKIKDLSEELERHQELISNYPLEQYQLMQQQLEELMQVSLHFEKQLDKKQSELAQAQLDKANLEASYETNIDKLKTQILSQRQSLAEKESLYLETLKAHETVQRQLKILQKQLEEASRARTAVELSYADQASSNRAQILRQAAEIEGLKKKYLQSEQDLNRVREELKTKSEQVTPRSSPLNKLRSLTPKKETVENEFASSSDEESDKLNSSVISGAPGSPS